MYKYILSLFKSLKSFKTITAIVYKVCSFSYYFILLIVFYLYEFGMSAIYRNKYTEKKSERKESENG